MIFNHWPFPTAYSPCANSYAQSRTITSWNAIDKDPRKPLATIILVKESTIIDIDIINTSHQVIKEVNGMADLIVTCPCLTEATSFTHNDSNLTATSLFCNLIPDLIARK
jgi:hypothetical protein